MLMSVPEMLLASVDAIISVAAAPVASISLIIRSAMESALALVGGETIGSLGPLFGSILTQVSGSASRSSILVARST